MSEYYFNNPGSMNKDFIPSHILNITLLFTVGGNWHNCNERISTWDCDGKLLSVTLIYIFLNNMNEKPIDILVT